MFNFMCAVLFGAWMYFFLGWKRAGLVTVAAAALLTFAGCKSDPNETVYPLEVCVPAHGPDQKTGGVQMNDLGWEHFFAPLETTGSLRCANFTNFRPRGELFVTGLLSSGLLVRTMSTDNGTAKERWLSLYRNTDCFRFTFLSEDTHIISSNGIKRSQYVPPK